MSDILIISKQPPRNPAISKNMSNPEQSNKAGNRLTYQKRQEIEAEKIRIINKGGQQSYRPCFC